MCWSALAQFMALLLEVVIARRQPTDAKELEIVVLRHQLRLLARRQPRLQLSRWERLTLTLIATKLRHRTSAGRERLSRSLVLVRPATVLRWHRDPARLLFSHSTGLSGAAR